jgi:transcriptional regulator with XRE-family HTH domain
LTVYPFGYKVAHVDKPAATKSLSRAVLDAMETRSVTQVALAQGTGVPRETLRRRLSGQSDFTIGELARIAAYLEMKPSDFADELDGVA